MKASRLMTAAIIFTIIFSLSCLGQDQSEQDQSVDNPVPNPSFEERGRRPRMRRQRGESRMSRNVPAGWMPNTWSGEARFLYDANTARTGERSVMVSSETGADAGWVARQVPVKPFSKYRLTGYIKTENLEATTGRGVQINIEGTEYITDTVIGTNDWTEVGFEFETLANESVQINCLFGYWGFSTGKAWFDDISLTLLGTVELNPQATIDASQTRQPISKYIYGQFIEHLGRCIYGGIWAEMLEDRKFCLPINQKYYDQNDVDPNRETFPIPNRRNPRSPWMYIGQDSVTMITEDSYVGELTPQVTVAGAPAGIIQNRLGLISGKDYEGRVVLAGDPEAAPIKVSLIWGKEPDERQTVIINKITPNYAKYHFAFKAGAGTINGKLEIVGTGNGKFTIGTASIMPADNIKGMRVDTLKLLKELNSPIYRWPGGNFVSGYNWKDGINPDRDKRPPRRNPAWTGIEHNDFGLHEFFDFLAEVNAEPFIALNAGLGSSESACQEVEYVNGSADTPMGKLRIANGGPVEPWDCTYWAVGNEMSGSWQLGNVPIEEFVKRHNEFSEGLMRVDPTIKLIASGEAANGNVNNWDTQLLTGCADYIHLNSKHFYCQDYRATGLMSHIMLVPQSIRRIAESHRTYLEMIPKLAENKVTVSLDEWNYWYGDHVFGELGTRYFLKDGIGIAAGINEYSRNTDVIFMANYAQTVNVIGCIKTSRIAADFETTGLVLKLYRKEFGTIPVEVSGQPLPLDVAATLSDDGTKLTVSIINPTEQALELPLDIENIQLTGKGKKWVMTGDDPLAYNEPGKPRKIDFVETPVSDFSKNLTLPAMSATLYSLRVK